MKKLQILGTGCPKCQKLTANTKAAALELGVEHEIEKITDLSQIMGFGVMLTPALVVNGVVKVAGKVPEIGELKKLLTQPEACRKRASQTKQSNKPGKEFGHVTQNRTQGNDRRGGHDGGCGHHGCRGAGIPENN